MVAKKLSDKQVELCLYMYKYLPSRISQLEIAIDEMEPALPGSVLKIVGRPQAKTPLDTSATERLGIAIATCQEAEELSAKRHLREVLTEWQYTLSDKDLSIAEMVYGKELSLRRASQRLGLPFETCRRRKGYIVLSARNVLQGIDIDLATM